MRFILTILILAFLQPVSAQIVQAEYFVDSDPGVGNGEAIAISADYELDVSFDINTTDMEDGHHTLYLRTRESDGGWSLYDKQLFYVSTPVDDTEIQSAEYFIDIDPGVGNGQSISLSSGLSVDENFTIPTEALETGIHTLYVRVSDQSGSWSLCDKQMFYLFPAPNITEIAHAEYFVDIDPGIGNGIPVSFGEGMQVDELIQVETESYDLGMHTFYLRVQDLAGNWTLYDKQIFRIQEAGPIITAEYFFDSDPGKGNGNEIDIDEGFNIYEQVELSAEGLEVGTHFLYVRVMDNDDVWSEVDTAEFEILTVSVDEHNFSFSVFPNPTTEEINLNSQTEIQSLTVYDMNGRQVAYRDGNHSRIEVNHLADGTYILHIQTQYSIHTFTFIKE